MMKCKKGIFLAFLLLFFSTHSNAGEELFVVEDIVIKGLQRIEPGTIFTYLPIEIGDSFNTADAPKIIKTLFKTKFFNDVVIEREGNVVVITVDERPTIVDIQFLGLEDITEDAMQDVLIAAGIQPGRIYNDSILDRIESELVEQYHARGKYAVKVDVNETLLKENKISIVVSVMEGEHALIKKIKIVGNRNYSDEELMKDFDSTLPVWYLFWKDSGTYSTPVLEGDIENLRSFYFNRGYLDFSIESSQVSLSKDKQSVYVVININEGERYTINKVEVAGQFVVPVEDIAPLISISSGQYISREELNKSRERIKTLLSENGYAFSNINVLPKKINDSEVDVSFFVDPGNRVYVRRIAIHGNITTSDEVFRRELRQMEGGWYSKTQIEKSRNRLRRLAFVENVSIEEVRIPGKEDMLDLVVKVEEKLAGNFSLGAGFGGSGTGVSLNAGVEQENFLGTGNRVSFNINTAKSTRLYSFDFYNPYHNLDNVSRGFGFNLQTTDTKNTSDDSTYESERFNLFFRYGIPMTESNRISFSIAPERYNVRSTDKSADEVKNFINKHGEKYTNVKLGLSYSIDTRNRMQFPTSGFTTSLSGNAAVPGSDIEYYKIFWKTKVYHALDVEEDLVIIASSNFGYGDGFGQLEEIPFFDKFKMGGPKSVRGYRRNDLSPKDSKGEPLGGDFMVSFSGELMFPTPVVEEKNFKSSIFIDAGLAAQDYERFEFSDMRGSVGLSFRWISPFGGLSFNFSTQFNDQEGDKTEGFQFNLGTL